MRYYLITAIIALAAAKAKSQAKDKLGNLKDGKNSEFEQQSDPAKVAVNCASQNFDPKAGSRKVRRRRFPDGANPVFAAKKHLI